MSLLVLVFFTKESWSPAQVHVLRTFSVIFSLIFPLLSIKIATTWFSSGDARNDVTELGIQVLIIFCVNVVGATRRYFAFSEWPGLGALIWITANLIAGLFLVPLSTKELRFVLLTTSFLSLAGGFLLPLSNISEFLMKVTGLAFASFYYFTAISIFPEEKFFIPKKISEKYEDMASQGGFLFSFVMFMYTLVLLYIGTRLPISLLWSLMYVLGAVFVRFWYSHEKALCRQERAQLLRRKNSISHPQNANS